jgi:hypothetical protein
MNTIHIFSAAVFAASVALSVPVQAQPAASASAPATAATMPHDCSSQMAKHDHGQDKGTPRPASMSAPCAPTAAASATKKSQRHNHAEFSKNS